MDCASIRFSHDLFVSVNAFSSPHAAAQLTTRRHVLVVRCGEKFSHTIARRTPAG